MSLVIAPTIGRRVWYWPSQEDFLSPQYEVNMGSLNANQAFDAGVIFVHNERTVNLLVTDHLGHSHARGSVELWQGDMDRPSGAYCEWMPFQKGQAKADAVTAADLKKAISEVYTNVGNILIEEFSKAKAEMDAARAVTESTTNKVNAAWRDMSMPELAKLLETEAERPNRATITRSRVCGVDCTPTSVTCNNYCGRDPKAPMANAPATYEVPAAPQAKNAFGVPLPSDDDTTYSTFGAALSALKAGGKVARTGWNGKGMWVKLQTPDANSKMSLPYFYLSYSMPGDRVPWVPSITDCLAEDWVLVP